MIFYGMPIFLYIHLNYLYIVVFLVVRTEYGTVAFVRC